jgi:hypothetical protein
MRLIISILFCCLIFSVKAQNREGFARSDHEKESLILLNNFMKALQLPKHSASKKACKPYMVNDETKITDLSFEKAHKHAIHFKYPVFITQVMHINPKNKEGFEYKIWIAKNIGMGVTPVSVHIFFPKDGSPPKVINVNNL